jgi:hypothetical protein
MSTYSIYIISMNSPQEFSEKKHELLSVESNWNLNFYLIQT